MDQMRVETRNVITLPESAGGAGPIGPATAYGVLQAMRACAGCDAAEIAERIEQTMLDVQSGGLRDDVALVVAQISAGAAAADRDEPVLTAVNG